MFQSIPLWPLTSLRTHRKPFLKFSYVMILLNGSTPIVFAGTEEPAAYGELISIGGLGPGVNGKLSSTIAEILQTKLQIDSSRFYIKFYDVQASYFGYNGSTF
ncbi:macrophage migration inhibitory factor homolog isoform X2 [Benincasa hispida]|uniref:macrophage migration inhibitory factor homolog isoform X2 n=1 Tax=Benincasa hispida TaxID=102211 RepID=UPI0019023792|nr:macrophage migration inhibitory factor homolog isoform X2 [Benincasa hispida]